MSHRRKTKKHHIVVCLFSKLIHNFRDEWSFFFFTNPNPSFRAPYRCARCGATPVRKDSHNPRVYSFVQLIWWVLLNESGSIVILSGHKKFDLFSMLSLAYLTHIYNHILSRRNRDGKNKLKGKRVPFRYPAVVFIYFRF